MANGDIVKLGTLYMSGVKQPRPTFPWYGTPTGAPGAGNIPSYSGGNLEIRDSDSSDAYRMQWVEVTVDGKRLLISDRVVMVNIPWNTLNTQELIFGKEVTINGAKYKLRVLTGGSNYRSGSDQYSGGSPANNEWDRIICNEGNFSGIPTPLGADLDNVQNAADFNGTHNSKWNWLNIYSWCQETYTGNSSGRAGRGCLSARCWYCSSASSASASFGWRPCLEALKSVPVLSDSDRDLGSFATPVTTTVSVTEGDGEKFSFLATLDGSTILSLTNQTDGMFTVDLTSRWLGLSNARHTLKLSATNSAGTASRTYTFTKANTPPLAPTIVSPANLWRMPASGYVTFLPTADPDGDTQTFVLQVANDAAFTQGLAQFSSGLQENKSGTTWTSVSNAPKSEIGKQFRLPYSGLAVNTQKYFRIVASDQYSSANSQPVLVKVGNVLEFYTFPTNRSVRPTEATIMLNAIIDPAATVQVFVCNNANDTSPTWEDATNEYKKQAVHTFSNTTKTNANWAVAMRVVITANGSTGAIEVSAAGMGVS